MDTLRSARRVLGTGDCRERWLRTRRSRLGGARVLATLRAAQPGPHRAPQLLAAGPAARHPWSPLLCHGHGTAVSQGRCLNVTLCRHFASDRAPPTCPRAGFVLAEQLFTWRAVQQSGVSRRSDSSLVALRMSLSPPLPSRVHWPHFLSHPFGFGLKHQRGVGRGDRSLGRSEAILEEEPRPRPPPRPGGTGRTSLHPGTAQDQAPRAPAAAGRLASAVCRPGAACTVVPTAPAARMPSRGRDLGYGGVFLFGIAAEVAFAKQNYKRNGCLGPGCCPGCCPGCRPAFPTVNLPSAGTGTGELQ